VRAGVLDSAPTLGPYPLRVTVDSNPVPIIEDKVVLGEPVDIDISVVDVTRITITFDVKQQREAGPGVTQAMVEAI
jgi:hypothetical protein